MWNTAHFHLAWQSSTITYVAINIKLKLDLTFKLEFYKAVGETSIDHSLPDKRSLLSFGILVSNSWEAMPSEICH